MSNLLERLADLQIRRPFVILLLAASICAGSLPLIRNLGLDSRFIALLPESRPSVQDLERVRDRVLGLSALTVAVQSPSRNVDAMRRFIGDLVKRLEELPPDEIGVIDWNIGAYDEFVREHKHLYASLDLLERLRDSLEERYDRERLKNNPFWVDLEEDDERETLEDILDELETESERGEKTSEQFPDGYYQHEDGDLIAMFIRSEVGSDASTAGRIIDRVQAEIDRLDPPSYGPDLVLTLSGDVIMAEEEQQTIARELVLATTLTVATVLLLIVLFFGRPRAIVLLGAGLVPPVLASFAVADITVDSLNASTAFLGSIIIGNGVNPNIIWLSRYFEQRRGGSDVGDAIHRAHQNTWLATMIASGAAALAYGSLMITDFRGFRDFGIIGGVGMILCWVSSITVLPAAVVAYERFRPFPTAKERKRQWGRYADAFAAVAERAPRGVVAASGVLSLLSVVLVTYAVIQDPFEYDFSKLRSVRQESNSEARRVQGRVNDILASHEQGRGIAVLLDSVDDVPIIEKQLDAMPPSIHAGHHSLYEFLPQDASQKLPLLGEIRQLCIDIRDDVEDEETLRKIDDNIPPERIEVPTLGDLPEEVALRFAEKDGTRGRIMVVEEAEEASIWDGRYLVRWAEALRTLRMSDGSRPPLAGRAPVFADMISAVYNDMPKAIGAAFLATVVLVLASFRRRRDSLLSIMALLMGILWMAGAMAGLGMKLNFLNFVAFPITFGNGVDYSINVLRRYRLEEQAGSEEPISSAVRLSGGAVVLCSLTTIVGYTSLYVSANQAMNSFGLAMAISEVTCLMAAVLTMPAVMIMLSQRKESR
ncbi:MAG: MMPL family transporter [Myxococcales bacterium]|nr:MMPL family transporter [Myxococcales bacterium]MDH3485452.1 MMPL family transporter [Myxococcales bacterium]